MQQQKKTLKKNHTFEKESVYNIQYFKQIQRRNNKSQDIFKPNVIDEFVPIPLTK